MGKSEFTKAAGHSLRGGLTLPSVSNSIINRMPMKKLEFMVSVPLCWEPLSLFQLISIFVHVFLNIVFIYFLERGKGREKERERNIHVWLPLTCSLLGTRPATQASALIGNWTCDLSVHRLALKPRSLTSQGSVCVSFKKCIIHLSNVLQ